MTRKPALSDDLRVYLDEVRDLLQRMDGAGVRLENGGQDDAAIQEFLRAAHTIKGSSAMLGFERMAAITHQVEDILDQVRTGRRPADGPLVDAILRAVDSLRAIAGKIGPGGEPPVDIEPLLASLRALASGRSDPEPSAAQHALNIDAIPQEVLERSATGDRAILHLAVTLDPAGALSAIRAVQVLKEAADFGDLVACAPEEGEIAANDTVTRVEALVATNRPLEELRHNLETLGDVTSVAIEELLQPPSLTGRADSASADAGPRRLQSVRVDIGKLDEIMNLVGEVVVERNRLEQLTHDLESRNAEDDLAKSLAQTSARIVKAVDGINRSMMTVRMLPAGLLFSTFPRLVRDLARKLNKSVDLTIEGEQTEMDRSVLEKIRDPLVHLIRNAVDHGIELPAARAQAGKPERGSIHLSASQEQGYVVVSLSDDGAGIDPAAVKAAAVRRHVLPADTAQDISEQAAVELIFRPELSTAAEATEVSGRGVGLDAVRREVEALSGTVDVRSERGRGTTVTMKLPLTLASFPGLLVEAAGAVYAIPTRYVKEAVRAERDSVQSIVGSRVINLRGSVTRLVSLAGLGRGNWNTANEWPHEYVVIVDTGEQLVGLGVDALTDQQEVVVKPLAGYTAQTRGIAGASVLGDGRVVLILDIATLFRQAPAAAPAPAVAIGGRT